MLHVVEDGVNFGELLQAQREQGVQLMLHYNGSVAAVSYETRFKVDSVEIGVRHGGIEVGSAYSGFDLRRGEAWYHKAVLEISDRPIIRNFVCFFGDGTAIAGITRIDGVDGPVEPRDLHSLKAWLGDYSHGYNDRDTAAVQAFVALCDKLLKVFEEVPSD